MIYWLKKNWNKFLSKPKYNKKDHCCIVNFISKYPNLSFFMYIFIYNMISRKHSNIDISLKEGVYGIFSNIFNIIYLDVLPNNLLFSVIKGCINGFLFKSINLGIYTMFNGISRCRYSLKNILINKCIYLFGIFCLSRVIN